MNNFDPFLKNSNMTAKIEYQDGICERWRIKLSDSFCIFIDCSTPGPSWGASSAKDFYLSVQIIGYECANGDFFLSSWESPGA